MNLIPRWIHREDRRCYAWCACLFPPFSCNFCFIHYFRDWKEPSVSSCHRLISGIARLLQPQRTVRITCFIILSSILWYCFLTILCTSLPLVAVIKYWGKKDVKLNTPLNSSVSVTLDQVRSYAFLAFRMSIVELLSKRAHVHVGWFAHDNDSSSKHKLTPWFLFLNPWFLRRLPRSCSWPGCQNGLWTRIEIPFLLVSPLRIGSPALGN